MTNERSLVLAALTDALAPAAIDTENGAIGLPVLPLLKLISEYAVKWRGTYVLESLRRFY